MNTFFGFVYFMWATVAVFVTAATAGHLIGAEKRMHALNILVYACLIGALWPLIPFWFNGDGNG